MPWRRISSRAALAGRPASTSLCSIPGTAMTWTSCSIAWSANRLRNFPIEDGADLHILIVSTRFLFEVETMPSLAFDLELAQSAGRLLRELAPLEEATQASLRLLDESALSTRLEIAGSRAMNFGDTVMPVSNNVPMPLDKVGTGPLG